MKYPVEIALRDLAQLMIALSDNHSTDVVLCLVSPDRVTPRCASSGSRRRRSRSRCPRCRIQKCHQAAIVDS